MRRNVYLRIVAFCMFLCAGSLLSAQDVSKKIVGDWSYWDSGGVLHYTFKADGTFSADATLTAPGYPRITIKKTGVYKVVGSNIEVTPTRVDSNGSPGEKVPEAGKYDAARDTLLLKQASAQSYTVYRRGNPPSK